MSKQPDPAPPRPVAPGAGGSLESWLSYLEAIHPSEIDLGLDRVLTVFRRLFRRPPKGRIVTVAGTNGKGSTVACLAQILRQAGRHVGTYTSPHLHRYNERITIDGQQLTDDAIVAAFERVEQARGAISLTYFEFGTLAAFVALADAGVEDWVLEIGLGGRLDAVNVVDADLAIITSVGIDHVDFLGDDREVIGFEKAGILRAGRPAIYAEMSPPRSVLQQVAAQGVQLMRLGTDYHLDCGPDSTVLRCPSLDRSLALPSLSLPRQSVAAAVVAAWMLEPGLGDGAIENALGRVHLPGRFERLSQAPDIYVDVGHNPHAAAWLAERLGQLKQPGQRVRGIYACLADKDSLGVIQALRDVVDYWYLAGLTCPRGVSVAELQARIGGVEGIESPALAISVGEALQLAIAEADEADVILVFGSFFTVAEARQALLGA
ncbi:bifunctional tetrahydrofolate synthase/dihydrofolate synthase [Marinobacter sp. SS21]|uniref:bifunctional tetrahydrofolate synthase/dihydrofolate synthase n=1 Tax=Marinobacter sp. SS21 TaxID=2979460 RepID=UPI00232DDCB0|nr:bifunctional tetrahydrofolate synthase/dihydrofolate synthase [Marinobacter sp. SS21]MDC0661868.1 bifunctional tetrahydrofolate synthase/dihydrofolate synthase [Marinobacter sp. SS21]